MDVLSLIAAHIASRSRVVRSAVRSAFSSAASASGSPRSATRVWAPASKMVSRGVSLGVELRTMAMALTRRSMLSERTRPQPLEASAITSRSGAPASTTRG